MKLLIRLTILILATCNLAFAQKSEYKIHVKRQQLIISHKSKPHALNPVDEIDAAKITDAEILFADRKEGFLYLVVDVSGQSKAKQDDRQCGAGIESNLIWIKLDSTWRIVDSNSVRYESCWSPTTSNDGLQLKDNALSIEIEDFHKDVNIKLSYNADQPDQGFQITEKALEESK